MSNLISGVIFTIIGGAALIFGGIAIDEGDRVLGKLVIPGALVFSLGLFTMCGG